MHNEELQSGMEPYVFIFPPYRKPLPPKQHLANISKSTVKYAHTEVYSVNV